MIPSNKRMNKSSADQNNKRIKLVCNYGESCYRMNPAHFREFSHPHLESILDSSDGSGNYDIPEKYGLQRNMLVEQLDLIRDNKLYDNTIYVNKPACDEEPTQDKLSAKGESEPKAKPGTSAQSRDTTRDTQSRTSDSRQKPQSKQETKIRDSDYRPVVPPTRDPRSFLDVVLPRGGMARKHAAAAPYYIFYTTIKDSKETHTQPYSITLLEILDESLGELKCSLQINFMVDAGWLLAHYYFAGYSEKKITILYGEESPDLKDITKKKPNVESHLVHMSTPFGKHHTKMMVLCYEDGSLRVVVSTANLYMDDWENRTQGLWMSPACPQLPPAAAPHAGESPTGFKRSLLDYLHHYHLPHLAFYVDRVKRCDFSDINVFLVCSVPGSHSDASWGLSRVGSLLRSHCTLPPGDTRAWPLLAQASSLGSYGKEPRLWLTGDFLHHFTKIKDQPQTLTQPPELKLIYPSLENVKRSHDNLLGGGCLPYAGAVHSKQTWLNNYLYQWRAKCSGRDRAMPHVKSYSRVLRGRAAYYLLTSGNCSKAAWGVRNKGNGALRVLSYEAGVLLLPRFVINEDSFPLASSDTRGLVLPYDVPVTKYDKDMTPWISDYFLWMSPACPQLPPAAAPHAGESPTGFKRSLLDYLHHYHLPQLAFYVDRVKRCDFSDINVFLVCSVPGSHSDASWGLSRVGSLLRSHCTLPPGDTRAWPLLAQASSLGSYGKEPRLWLTGDFLHHFTKIKDQPQTLTQPPELKLIYPSLENVKRSHDNLLGGGCLPYAGAVHSKQTWLNNYLYQWRAKCSGRDRAMPHVKSYTRVLRGRAAYYLLTSGNCSKAAWGVRNKGNGALRVLSYEAGVLLLPRFVINEDSFPLASSDTRGLVLPYDVPVTKYDKDMTPWISDYLYE